MSTHQLARKFEPILVFSRDDQGRDENFYPMAVEHYVTQCRLYRPGMREVQPPGGVSLSQLGSIDPRESKEHYLSYVAGDVLPYSDTWRERLENGWLTLYGVGGAVEPHLLVEPGPAVAFGILDDPGLRLVEAPDLDAGELAFTGPGGQVAGIDYLITDSQHLPVSLRDKALERYAPQRDFSAYPPVYYYRVMHNRGYRVIQYWFFYAYNDWGTSHGGVNDHEGDWESVFVFLRGEEPAYVAFSAHVGAPAWYAWEDAALEKRFQNHPLVYVGCGSHASYPQKGVHRLPPLGVEDFALGNGSVAIGPGTGQAWGTPVDLAQQPWALNFAGHWGALVKKFGTRLLVPGAQAPTGPAWHFDQWERPVHWARIPY